MDVRIIIVGSNRVIAEEVRVVVCRILGIQEQEKIVSMITANVTGKEDADLYICAVTQRDALLKKVGPEKLNVLDLRPTAQFFIDVSHIPTGERVYIFNSNTNYAKLLQEMCRKYKIEQLEFIPIAYEEMTNEEVIEKLQQAKYIIGVGKIVGKEVLLSKKYRPYLRKDVIIIGRMRMATMQTACNLIQQVNTIRNQQIAKKIATLVEALMSVSYEDATAYRGIAAELEQLVNKKADDEIPLQLNLMNSFAAQLSDKLVASESKKINSTEVTENKIVNVLEKFERISERRAYGPKTGLQ
jgi:hypothetical protein